MVMSDPASFRPKRIMIVGQPGSGKSTLARKLGGITGLPVVHMDKIHWMANWTPRDMSKRWEMVRDVHAQDEWIFEGGFSRSWNERAARAQLLIWLDVGLWRRLWRVTLRFVRYYGKSRPDMADGCFEGNWSEMWEFYKWIWRTRRSARSNIRNLIKTHEAKLEVKVLHTIAETERYLAECHA